MNTRIQKMAFWLEEIQMPKARSKKSNIEFGPILDKANKSDSTSYKPSCARATNKYQNLESKKRSSNNAPLSLTEGLQTIVNLCRINAGFDPLDPDGNGDLDHYKAFIEELRKVPIFKTAWSGSSKWSMWYLCLYYPLAGAFVNDFFEIPEEHKAELYESTYHLRSAAVSSWGDTETEFYMVQNVLDTHEENGEPVAQFNLYSSVFSVMAMPTMAIYPFYMTYYEVYQEAYTLSQSDWDEVSEEFTNILKTTLEEWLAYMNEETKELCLS